MDQTDSGWMAGLGALLAGLIGAASTAAVFIWRARKRETRRDRAQEHEIHSEILDRQEKHIKRLDEQLQRDGRMINHLYGAFSECRESEALLYGHIQMLHGIAMRHANELRSLGRAVDEVPLLPDRPRRVNILDEFEVRTAEQSAELAHAATSSIVQEGKPP